MAGRVEVHGETLAVAAVAKRHGAVALVGVDDIETGVSRGDHLADRKARVVAEEVGVDSGPPRFVQDEPCRADDREHAECRRASRTTSTQTIGLVLRGATAGAASGGRGRCDALVAGARMERIERQVCRTEHKTRL